MYSLQTYTEIRDIAAYWYTNTTQHEYVVHTDKHTRCIVPSASNDYGQWNDVADMFVSR